MRKKVAGYCTLCRSRCGSQTVVDGNRIAAIEPLRGHPTGGALCAKGRASPEMVHSPERLKSPMRRISAKGVQPVQWEEISWEAALDEVASKLGDIRTTAGAEAVAFAMTTPSGTPMVDSSEWVERFIRCFGSPNLIYAVEVCGWHKDYAHELTFGRGIGFPDYENAEVILLWGHNPARTWLAQASRIADARARGAKIIVVDPKPNGSGQQADLWLRVRPGADSALAMGAIRHLIETATFDRAFVDRWTNAALLVDVETGRLIRACELIREVPSDLYVTLSENGEPVAFDPRTSARSAANHMLEGEIDVLAHGGRRVRAKTVFRLLREASAPYTKAHVADLTWIDEASLQSFYSLLEGSPKLAYHSWTGVGQHTNATAIERAIATMYALIGAEDKAGGNIWPVPPPTRAVNPLTLLPEGQREKALGLAELPLGPPARGWITARDFSRAVNEGLPYQVRALMSFGTNFVVSQADAARNLETLRRLDFHVHADIFMNPTGECADIVLPVNLSPERDALKIGFEIDQAAVETIQFRPKMIECAFEARADYEIAFELADRLGFGDRFFGGSIEAGWNWQLEPLGVTVEELRASPLGQRFPQGFSYGKYQLETEPGRVRGFPTASGLIEIYSEQLHDIGFSPIAEHVEPDQNPMSDEAGTSEFSLVLTTAKSGWFVHTSHRQIGSLRKKSPDPAVEICGKLAAARGLRDGDWALVSTQTGETKLRVRINDALHERVVVSEFGWWQASEALNRPATPNTGPETTNVNAILSDKARDPVSGSVPLRAVLCNVRPHPTANQGRWVGKRAFRIAAMRSEAQDIVAIDLEPQDGGPVPDYLPGQHVVVSISDSGPARSYSLTGSGRPCATLPIAVRRQGSDLDAAEGRSLSAAIHLLRVGDMVRLEAPSGVFTPPTSTRRPIVFLAAGIGITPFIGVLERMLSEGDDAEIHLLHGCRSGDEHPFAERLNTLASALPNLRTVTAYSSPLESDVMGRDFTHAGRVDFGCLATLVDRRPLVYICGSPGFTESAVKSMKALGVPSFDIMSEAFTSPKPVPPDLAPQTVHVAGTGRSFEWRPELGSLLDAALAAGFAMPSGCRVGQCESCVCKVVSGEVAHLNTPDIDSDLCVTCQAVPLAELTLAI